MYLIKQRPISVIICVLYLLTDSNQVIIDSYTYNPILLCVSSMAGYHPKGVIYN